MRKAWWQSKTVVTLLGQLLFTWSAYFLSGLSIKLCIGNSLLSIASIAFRAVGTQAVGLKRGKE